MAVKKGMVFSLLAIVIISVILFFIIMQASYKLSDKMQVVSSRVETVNDFVLDVKEDLKRATYISGFRSVMSMEEYIANNGVFISDVNSAFNESILTGKINGQDMSFMAGSTLNYWIDKIEFQGSKIGVVVEIYDEEISVSQSDPWHVDIYLNVTINATDTKGTAQWRTRELLLTKIPIDRFEDPTYTVHTYGRVLNGINMTPYEGEYNGTNLYYHVENSYYTNSSIAPSFLDRLEGGLDRQSSCCGIESFVNLNKLNSAGLSICETCSCVDYVYFSGLSGIGGYAGMQNWFKIDDAHKTKYGLS